MTRLLPGSFWLGPAILLALLGGGIATGQEPAPRGRSQSPSGQFIIYGLESEQRSTFAKAAEAFRKDVIAVLRFSPEWRSTFVIELREPTQIIPRSSRRARGRVYPLATGGYRFQLDLLLDEYFDLESFQRELLELLLLEQMLDPPPRQVVRDTVPPWLEQGLYELVLQRRGGRPTQVYASLIEARQIIPIGELMAASSDAYGDSVSRQIYAVCSAALIEALLEQGNGSRRFKSFLQDLAADSAEPSALLRVHFPALDRSDTAIEKWWALQMASMSRSSAFERLSQAETEAALDAALQIRFESSGDDDSAPGEDVLPQTQDALDGPGFLARLPGFRNRGSAPGPSGPSDFRGGTLADWEAFRQHPDAARELAVMQSNLFALATRCFPLYSPVVTAYAELCGAIREGNTAGANATLTLIDQDRAALSARMGAVSDYLNWFEATQLTDQASAFEGYEKALRDLDRLERYRPPRRDPISTYLDAMERELRP